MTTLVCEAQCQRRVPEDARTFALVNSEETDQADTSFAVWWRWLLRWLKTLGLSNKFSDKANIYIIVNNVSSVANVAVHSPPWSSRATRVRMPASLLYQPQKQKVTEHVRGEGTVASASVSASVCLQARSESIPPASTATACWRGAGGILPRADTVFLTVLY